MLSLAVELTERIDKVLKQVLGNKVTDRYNASKTPHTAMQYGSSDSINGLRQGIWNSDGKSVNKSQKAKVPTHSPWLHPSEKNTTKRSR